MIHGDFLGAYKILMVIPGQSSLMFEKCLIPPLPERVAIWETGRSQRLTLELRAKMDSPNLKPRVAIFPLGDSTSRDGIRTLHTAPTPPRTACILQTAHS